MRRFGCLIIVLALLAGALVLADAAATTYAEERIEARVERSYGTQPDVELSGWPVAARVLLLGRIPHARITARDVPLENGATVSALEVALRDVDVSVADLQRSRGRRLPPAEQGTFEAILDEQSVAGMLGLPGGVAQVTLEQGVVRIGAGGITVDADVEARDGDVVVSVRGPLATLLGGGEFPIDLSDQPGAPAADEFEVADGAMVVRGTLEDVRR